MHLVTKVVHLHVKRGLSFVSFLVVPGNLSFVIHKYFQTKLFFQIRGVILFCKLVRKLV